MPKCLNQSPHSPSTSSSFSTKATRTETNRSKRAVGLIFGAVLLSTGLILDAAEKLSLPPERAAFKTGPGVEVAMAQCLLCHSADYVSTQPRLSRTTWKATVLKMREKYGAPMPEDKVDPLVDYLVKTYGAEKAK